jgi:hypothetical protein
MFGPTCYRDGYRDGQHSKQIPCEPAESGGEEATLKQGLVGCLSRCLACATGSDVVLFLLLLPPQVLLEAKMTGTLLPSYHPAGSDQAALLLLLLHRLVGIMLHRLGSAQWCSAAHLPKVDAQIGVLVLPLACFPRCAPDICRRSSALFVLRLSLLIPSLLPNRILH